MSRASSHFTSTYAATLDAGVDEAYDAFRAIDPMSSLARRLRALGIGERVVRVELSEASGLSDTDGGRDLGFGFLWRFGPAGQTATVSSRVRLTEDGAGRTVLSIATRVRPSDDEARNRIATAWPIIETIALAHARSVRRDVEDYAADPCEAEPPRALAALNAAA